MKKLLLGWLMVGCFAVSAQAASCSISFVDPAVVANNAVTDPTSLWYVDPTQFATVEAYNLAVAAQTAAYVANINTAGNLAVDAQNNVANAIIAGIRSNNNVLSLGGSGFARTDTLRSVDAMAAVAQGGYDCGWELWLNPFAVWASDDAKGLYNGYDADTYGANLGITKKFTNFKLGAFVGYAYGDVDVDRGYGSYNSDNFTAGLLGGFDYNNFFVNASAGYTWSDINDYKFLNSAGFRDRARDRDGDSWFTNIELGYVFNLGNCWKLIPSVGWTYVSYEADAFAGILGGDIIGKGKGYSSRLPVMLKIERTFQNGLNAFVRGGYIREFNDNANTTAYWVPGQNVWTISTGRDPQKNFGQVGAGVNGYVGRAKLGLSYDYVWGGSSEDAHVVNALIGWTF